MKDDTRKLRWKNGLVESSLLALTATLLLMSVAAAQSHQQSVNAREQLRTEALERVGQSTSVQIEFTNFEVVPMSIISASVKEIGNTDFLALTGVSSDSPAYTTYPEVTLLNTTGKRITGLALMMGNRRTRKVHGVNFMKVVIEPRASFAVQPADWVRAEGNVRIAADGKVTKRIKPGLDSDKMWWPGEAREMVLRVGMVVFEDRSKWTISSEMDPW